MQLTKNHRTFFLLGAGIIVAAALLPALLPRFFPALDEIALGAKYSMRGESRIDSSVVILYFDNNDIVSLGGLPLRRSYYAALLAALDELGAKCVGVDIAFTEPDIHGDEYDDLLASVIRSSGNVVLSGYFHSLSPPPSLYGDERNSPAPAGGGGGDAEAGGGAADPVPERFTLPEFHPPYELRTGLRPALPLQKLLDAAAGFGHTVLSTDASLPLLLRTGSGRCLPAFPLAVYLHSRVSDTDTAAAAAGQSGGAVGAMQQPAADSLPPVPSHAMPENAPALIAEIPVASGAHGDVLLNYMGGTTALNMVPAIRFLGSYAAWRAGGNPPAGAEMVRDKIVLVGIVAEGRSAFLVTPFDHQFPSIGVHATFLHNAIHRNFLRRAPAWLQLSLLIVLGILTLGVIMFVREPYALLAILVLVAGLAAASFALFSAWSYDLPVASPVFCIIAVFAGTTLYSHSAIRRDVRTLLREKETIEGLLREKERTLFFREARLSALQAETRESSLLREEIRKYELEIAQLRSQATDLQPFSAPIEVRRREQFGIVYGTPGPMADVVAMVEKIADSDATVLLLGESGTGKELVARALHQCSPRRDKPFIAVNCGALTETLLESELFGHERGSFTGALKDRVGRFELAADGTIFLDEIAETSEAFQVKMLRVLQDKTFERVGGAETKRSNARVIAAANRDLRQAVAEKQFREDLFYRLNVLTLPLPPLRERPRDIPLLIAYFMHQEQPGLVCSENAMDILRHYAWKGNVRELQSVITRAALLARADGRTMIRLKDIPPEIVSSVKPTRDIEDLIISSLREKGFSRSAIADTAEELGGLNRGTVAEYFRGYCFKVFAESRWSLKAAVEQIAANPDAALQGKVAKKLIEYLRNGIEQVDPAAPLARVQEASKPKFKNLPQRYHAYLDSLIAASYNGEFTLDSSRKAPLEN